MRGGERRGRREEGKERGGGGERSRWRGRRRRNCVLICTHDKYIKTHALWAVKHNYCYSTQVNKSIL